MNKERKIKDSWSLLAERAACKHPEYIVNDELLVEILIKLYWRINDKTPDRDGFILSNRERKLFKTKILGNNDFLGVCYSVMGSPSKGTIFIMFNSNHKGYYYEREQMTRISAKKYEFLHEIFLDDAKKFIKEV